jgi:serine protease Do
VTRCAALLVLLCLVAAPVAAQPEAAPVSDQARAVFERSRDRLLQVRMIDRSTQAQASIGSGWIASADGLAVTNYHVVSQFVIEPERYAVEFVRSDGTRGALSVLAVDVLHDLAVVRMPGGNLPHLRLNDDTLRKGDRGFAMGNPHDLGLTIVEGTYNGFVEYTLNEQFHFTGAINAGMSGGPAVTADGRVFGVNVANLRDGQLVSFLVPVKFARDLLALAPRETPEPQSLRGTVERQLLARQENLVARIGAAPLPASTFGRYTVPDSLGHYMRCWGDSDLDRTLPYEISTKQCDAQGTIFVSGSFDTGDLRYRHELLKSRKLGTIRFSSLYERSFNKPFPERDGTREDVTRFRCHEQFVTATGGTLRVATCFRAYKRLKGLYDLRLKAATLDRTDEGLQTWFTVDGVSFDNGLKLAQRYLEAIRWTN